MNIVCQSCKQECPRTGRRQKLCHPCAKEAQKARAKAWREANLEEIRAHDRARIDPERNRAKVRAWHAANPEMARENAAKWYAKNKEKAVAAATAWAESNQERRKQIRTDSAKRRRAENPEKAREAKRRRREDAGVRLNDSVSAYVRGCLKGRKAGASWESLLGYTLSELMGHLEARFVEGMSWENYGEWHIDHIRPVASFTFSTATDDDFRQCWSLGNLQPLWAIDNARKNSHWNGVRVQRSRAAQG